MTDPKLTKQVGDGGVPEEAVITCFECEGRKGWPPDSPCDRCNATGKVKPEPGLLEIARAIHEGDWDLSQVTRNLACRRADLILQGALSAIEDSCRKRWEEELLSDESCEAAARVWCQGFDAFPRGEQRKGMDGQRRAMLAALKATRDGESDA